MVVEQISEHELKKLGEGCKRYTKGIIQKRSTAFVRRNNHIK